MRNLLIALFALFSLLVFAPAASAHQPDLSANWQKAKDWADGDCGSRIDVGCASARDYEQGVFFGSHSRSYLFSYREQSGGPNLFQYRNCTTRIRMNLHYANDFVAGVYYHKKKCGGWYSS